MKIIPDEKTIERSHRSRNHTAVEQTQFLRRWEASGLTAAAFAKLHPVKAESLYRWRMKEKSEKTTTSEPSRQTFRELNIDRTSIPAPSPSQAPTITLRSPAFEISLSGFGLSESLPTFLKALRREVFGV